MRNSPLCRVRGGRKSDKTALMHLLRLTPEFEPAEIPVAEEVLDGSLASPGEDYQTLVAEIERKVVGYICFGQTPLTGATWDIYWMAVEPIYRGQGIGSSLLQAAEKHILEHQGKLILIETSSKSNYRSTRRFYRHMGYRQVGRIRDYYAPGDNRVILEKRF